MSKIELKKIKVSGVAKTVEVMGEERIVNIHWDVLRGIEGLMVITGVVANNGKDVAKGKTYSSRGTHFMEAINTEEIAECLETLDALVWDAVQNTKEERELEGNESVYLRQKDGSFLKVEVDELGNPIIEAKGFEGKERER